MDLSLSQIACALALARLILTLALGYANAAWVASHRAAVPKAFAGRVSLDEHMRAADYTIARQRLGYVSDIFHFVVLMAWSFGGGLAALDTFVCGIISAPMAQSVAGLALFVLVSTLIDLPLDVWRTFRLEAAFGFNQTTQRTYILDQLKGLALGAALGLPLLSAIVYLLRAPGAWGWLQVWGLWSGFSILMLWAYPALIAPLFNVFRPLEDADIKQRIQHLLDRCGFTSRGVFVMDGSTRSSHGNAYFTGLGANKRVVFFDTLLKTLSVEEIEGVLAHELGHFKLRHVQMGLVTSIGVSGVLMYGLQALVQAPEVQMQLGLAHASVHGALILAMLWLPVAMFWTGPIGAWRSRCHEYAADAFAAQYVRGAALASGLVKLYRDNASTLTPHPLYVWMYASHPPATARIAQLERLDEPVKTASQTA